MPARSALNADDESKRRWLGVGARRSVDSMAWYRKKQWQRVVCAGSFALLADGDEGLCRYDEWQGLLVGRGVNRG